MDDQPIDHAGNGERGLIDLPLREGERAARPEPPMRREPAAPSPPPRRPSPRRGSRRWPLLALVLAAAVAAWFLFVPRPPKAVFSEPQLGLGEARVGGAAETRTVTVQNGGERPMVIERVELAGEAAAEFSIAAEECAGATLEPLASCVASVGFAPAAAGARRAELVVVGNLRGGDARLPLAGVGTAPRVELEPAALDFGSAGVDEPSAPSPVRIVNRGTAPLAIHKVRLAGDHPGDFDLAGRCSGTTVAPEEACTFTVTFTARAAGAREARLAVASDAPGDDAEIPVRGLGVWAGPSFTADRDALDFGAQRAGRRGAPLGLELVNRAGATRAAPEAARVAGAGFELVTDGCRGRAVAPGEACRLEIAFTPPGGGAREGALTVPLPDGKVLEIPLAGRGIEPRLAPRPERLDFGGALVGSRTAARTVTLANTGEAPLAVASLRLDGDREAFRLARDRCSGSEVAAGKSCEVEVDFAPPDAGDHRARLEIRSDAAGGPRAVELVGRGTVAGLAARPGSLDFGEVVLGAVRDREIAIVNTGSARLVVSSLRPEGTAADEFRVVEIGCGLDAGLAPGDDCTLRLAFEPSESGERTAWLSVRHNGPGSPGEIPLRGRGEAPLPGFAVTPAAIDFGTLPAGERSSIETVTVRNPGRGDLNLVDFQIAGRHAADFRIVPGTCQGAPRIVPGAECSVGVRFLPEGEGERRAELVIRHGAPGGEGRVRLLGRGASGAPQ